jgi:hypothetical protein
MKAAKRAVTQRPLERRALIDFLVELDGFWIDGVFARHGSKDDMLINQRYLKSLCLNRDQFAD